MIRCLNRIKNILSCDKTITCAMISVGGATEYVSFGLSPYMNPELKKNVVAVDERNCLDVS